MQNSIEVTNSVARCNNQIYYTRRFLKIKMFSQKFLNYFMMYFTST